MRIHRTLAWGLLPFLAALGVSSLYAAPSEFLQLGEQHHADGEIELVQYQPSTQRFDSGSGLRGLSGSSLQPFDPSGQPFDPGSGLGGAGGGSDLLGIMPEQTVGGGGERFGSTNAGETLSNSDAIQSVATQRRSQISFDPHIRGYRFGQIYSQADGEYWLPVRPDLDSMLTKIDPGSIDTMTVIPGPYTARYGLGFGFIDVNTFDTPRSQNGYETHNRFGLTVKGNGGQVNFRDFLSGGDADSGYRIGYGNRTGSDYSAGNGDKIPASYRARNAIVQLGYDLSPDDRVEVRYNRMDQSDTEYYLQVFDVSSLITDSFNVKYVLSDPDSSNRLIMNAWWNGSRLNGNNFNASKASVNNRIITALQADDNANNIFQGDPDFTEGFLATTFGHLNSSGMRLARVIGEPDDLQFRSGADVRLIQQRLLERYQETNNLNAVIIDETTQMYHSTLVDPGIFMEVDLPWASYLNTSIGGRLDWAYTKTRGADAILAANSNDPNATSQSDILYSFFVNTELEMNEVWTSRFGLGYSQRVPDLVNRYAGGIFMGITQNGLNHVVGQLDLQKERVWQADVALHGDWDVARCRASAFYAWIQDYNTYTVAAVDDPQGAQVLFAHNTAMATLTGFELYGEADLTQYWTLFSSAAYVQGADQAIHQPLWGIYPLEGRIGLRVADPIEQRWGGELAARIVAQQNRLGTLQITNDPGQFRTIEQRTGGFTTLYMRGYYNLSPGMQLTAGIDNIFNRLYIEHLDLRLPATASQPAAFAYAPGTTGYFGVEWTY